ncbi:hypothetical protein SISSUDRAFT_784019 [Sistotremastrum suecicum HHB10207 ss-3]|uniref:Peptidase M20 domain-containing protein 2 n=1 Tax=Sistotremastrum suecicum HHB10207 ss-3 TaxID=1314776 RepID=A0A166D2W3_9AGAM|nr:hypothetical protein SISSUDRAFT_784019 [Sistotremastrum suecicum HHB10207 ss-3]
MQSQEDDQQFDCAHIDMRPCCQEILKMGRPPSYEHDVQTLWRPEVLDTIKKAVDGLSDELRELSLKIHDHPEIMFEEKFAHDTLTAFMEKHGFEVTRHYLGMETAWRASFTHSKGHGRVIGVNSEMDALPGIGHACGHNLIAVAGVGTAIAIKVALKKHNIPGTVVLLGTPAEEGGNGKGILIEKGGYDGMHACIMCHPSVGPKNSTVLGTTLALTSINVEYTGHTAHAAAAPWEGRNALDAAFLAYSSVSMLRQQIKPTHRVHGVVYGDNWAANIIPDKSRMRWYIRAPTWNEVQELRARVLKCFEAAAKASACELKIELGDVNYELRQNPVLGENFVSAAGEGLGMEIGTVGEPRASTDFGNVTYFCPALHPGYGIPTVPDGGNHTPAFTKAAASIEAHKVTMSVTKALAHTGIRVLDDDDFYKEVKDSFTASQ